MPEYDRGYRDGIRKAVAWLHARAKEMNDPHATRILDSAGFSLGVDRALGRVPAPWDTHPKGQDAKQLGAQHE